MSESEKDEKPGEGVDESRRDFVRKASYTAPALIALGFAAHSPQAGAQGPPSPPAFGPSTELKEEDPLLDEIESAEAESGGN